MVRIITDSAADFEHSESEKFGISTIPLAVYIDGKEYKDDFLHSKERRKHLNPRRMSTNVL